MVARFSAPVQLVPVAHPDSYTVGTVYSSEVKWPGLGLNTRNPSRAEVKEIVQIYLYSNSGPS